MKVAISLACVLLCLSAVSTSYGAGLATEPTVFTSGEWSVRRGKDSMTDKPSCTGLFRNRYDIQLNEKAFFLSLKGRGGVDVYTLRFDDEPPLEMRGASDIEKSMGTMVLSGADFNKLLDAKRLRVRVSTILDSIVEEDINLTGLKEAEQYIASSECH